MSAVDFSSNYGPLLIGGLASAIFSGMLAIQCILYSKTFVSDPAYIKAIVTTVWCLDVIHSGLIWTALWHWFVSGFGKNTQLDHIPRALPVSILFTAITTLVAHCVFGWRILQLSKRNWWICGPIFLTAVLRVVSAAACSGEMIRIGSFMLFKLQFKWLFSLGLTLSSFVDVLITAAMIVTLQKRRESSLTLNTILDSLIIYTFENGFMTSIATVASLICWLAMDNFVFLGLYFVVAKFYANSVLAIFNRRARLHLAHDSQAKHGSSSHGYGQNGVVELIILPHSPGLTGGSPNNQSKFGSEDQNSPLDAEPASDMLDISRPKPVSPASHSSLDVGTKWDSVGRARTDAGGSHLQPEKSLEEGREFGPENSNNSTTHHGGVMKSVTVHVQKD